MRGGREVADGRWSPGTDLPWRLGLPPLRLWRRLGYRLQVDGAPRLPARGAVLVVANHVSFRDPLVLVTVAADRGRRLRALAVEAAFHYPVTGWFLRASGMIPVPSRHGRERSARAAAEALAAGEAVLLYPEGTIPRAGQAVRAQPGIGWLALQSGAPVVPVATGGLERASAPRRWGGWRARGFRRRPVRVLVGDEVGLDDLRAQFAQAPDRRVVTALARVAAERSLAAVRELTADLEGGRGG